MSEAFHGPGILWVQSRISPTQQDIFSENAFLEWYDDDHIPETVSTSSIKSGFRYINVLKTSPCGSPTSPKPFLAFYPMSDLSFTQREEFRNISTSSDSLPGSGSIFDLVEFDISCLGFLGSNMNSRGSAKYILTCELRPNLQADKGQVESFYESQISQVSAAKGYSRTLRFESQYPRIDTQSPVSTGVSTGNETHAEPSTWLAIHEFDEAPATSVVTTLEHDTVTAMATNEWEGSHEVHLWQCEKVHGEGSFFSPP